MFIKLKEINGIFLKVLAVTYYQGGSNFFNFEHYKLKEDDILGVLNKCLFEKMYFQNLLHINAIHRNLISINTISTLSNKVPKYIKF